MVNGSSMRDAFKSLYAQVRTPLFKRQNAHDSPALK
jgi:hypothetical protein